MFRFIHAADLHLDSPLRGLEAYADAPVAQIRGATRRALENLVDLAVAEQVAFVLLAGDVYDGDWKDYNTALFFARCMARLGEAGIAVFMISGNHDAASVIARALRPPDNVHLFSVRRPETILREDLGVAVHGQGYAVREVRDDLARAYPSAVPGLFNIGLLHSALTGRPGHQPYAPTSLDILRGKGYHYWALGHVHQREILNRSPWIVFSGNIQGRHIRETGARGCTLVTVDEGQVRQVEQRDLDVLRWRECRVATDGCDSQEELFRILRRALEEARADAGGRPLAVRLIFTGACALHDWLHRHAAHWTQECRALAVSFGDLWLEQVRLETRPEGNLENLFEDSAPLGGLARAIRDIRLTPDLTGQMPELAELQVKLPSELTGGEDPFDPLGEAQRARLEEDVRELLLGRLLGKERQA
jgi:DNA repair exonuclease SbcCD nuclease subunit